MDQLQHYYIVSTELGVHAPCLHCTKKQPLTPLTLFSQKRDYVSWRIGFSVNSKGPQSYWLFDWGPRLVMCPHLDPQSTQVTTILTLQNLHLGPLNPQESEIQRKWLLGWSNNNSLQGSNCLSKYKQCAADYNGIRQLIRWLVTNREILVILEKVYSFSNITRPKPNRL